MCEAFNRAILEYRDKPIINLLEGLKFYICNRIVSQRELIMRYKGDICPMIQKNLEKIKRAADGWTPHWAGDEAFALFEVRRDQDKYKVNLSEKKCSFRRWELSGAPCCHAVTCMWHNNNRPEDFVASCYSCNGPKLWPTLDSEPIQPPYMRRAPGRPKKQRRKTNDEPRNPYKLPKQNKTTRCSERGTLGHNKTSCKGKTAAVPLIGSYRRVVIRRITGSKGQQLHHSKKKRQKHKNHKHKKGKHNLFKHNPAKHQL